MTGIALASIGGRQEQEALQEDLLLQEVLRIRRTQKRLGARKLLVMMSAFMAEQRKSKISKIALRFRYQNRRNS
jgi:hypothetical protein